MAEMNRTSRFLVNTLGGRRNARIDDWIQGSLTLPAGAACLEIGCGNGDMAARLVDGLRPARYVATDLDTRQLESARHTLAKRYPQGLPPMLELGTADMLRLAFEDASFDAVFAFMSLHHASPSHFDPTNVPRALAEIDRVLRPHGALVYLEFLHKDRIHAWLAEHGYVLEAVKRGLRRETAVARKAAA